MYERLTFTVNTLMTAYNMAGLISFTINSLQEGGKLLTVNMRYLNTGFNAILK